MALVGRGHCLSSSSEMEEPAAGQSWASYCLIADIKLCYCKYGKWMHSVYQPVFGEARSNPQPDFFIVCVYSGQSGLVLVTPVTVFLIAAASFAFSSDLG